MAYCKIYPKVFEFKVKHQGGYDYFLNFNNASYTKQQPLKYFLFSDERWFLRNASSTLWLIDFISKAKELLERIKQQFKSSKRDITGISLKKIILPHPDSFQHFHISWQDFIKTQKISYNTFLQVPVDIYICMCINYVCI